ncbi:chalcone isomerase family protein [Vibrio zhugei]|uniref:Chalcone isomerase family protein n=1 Tax=Vibrio zhugei TaxID=2479546 RepID=A0ABV7C9H5_9VIBR|nr:chalcone isomerase family protein [Vibrio zhugei]
MIKHYVLLALLSMAWSASVLAKEPSLAQWQRVGQAHFTWLWFDVYDSTLYTPNGRYVDLHSPLALHIEYRRTISAQDLLTATEKQWKKLTFKQDDIDQWLSKLKTIFPSVEEGDQLVYQSNGKTGTFYFKPVNQSDFHVVGDIESPTFNTAFLSIWLSPQSQYPDLRKQLIGVEHHG